MTTTDPNLILMLFYLTSAILLLAVGIIVYPTLRERAKKKS
jgi:hypothetical protein